LSEKNKKTETDDYKSEFPQSSEISKKTVNRQKKSSQNYKNTKKVVLFIVEGKTDKAALGLIMTRLFPDETVRFAVVNGDFTIQGGISAKNAVGKMSKYINEFLKKSHYLKTDISRVVHIIDTDGAFISEKDVHRSDGRGTWYMSDCIETSFVEETRGRIKQKRLVTTELAAAEKIGAIDYHIYYLSRNLEHVMHGESNSIDSRQKGEFANEIEDRYGDEPKKFVKFLKDGEFAVEGEYAETWEHIMIGTNSLKRKSNLHLCFEK